MKSILAVLLAVLLAGLAGGVSASDLPDCAGDRYDTWNNCFGTYTWAGGNKYVGEWKGSRFNGQGTFTYGNLIQGGTWKDNEFLGTVTKVERKEQARIARAEREKQARITKEEREKQARIAKKERERLARLEKRDKYERIYNACMLDKSPSVDMSVTSVEKAVKATCDSIAEDPSFLEGLRYD